MYEVTVEDSFAAGHYLRNYRGKCENPHGHNYKVRITLQGRELDQAGLLLDFKELKMVMKPVIERLDHRNRETGPPDGAGHANAGISAAEDDDIECFAHDGTLAIWR